MNRYAKIASWHVVSLVSRASMPLKARCGRSFAPNAPTADELPLGEPSCETCARLVLHDQDEAR